MLGAKTYAASCLEVDLTIDGQLLGEGVIDRLEWWDMEEGNPNVEAGIVEENALEVHVVRTGQHGQDARMMVVHSQSCSMGRI